MNLKMWKPMEQLTTYRVKGKSIGLIFLFKYNLNGVFKSFEIVEGELNNEQMTWLYSGNFPATESIMKTIWCKAQRFTKLFIVDKSLPDISFEAFWVAFDLKRNKEKSQKAFDKLTEADKIKCFLALPKYNRDLQNTGQAKAHLVTWINQKRFNDEY